MILIGYRMLRFSALVLLAGLCIASARADVDAVITLARSALGSEADLAAVKSIHYTATLEAVEPPSDKADKPAQTVWVELDIVFQKPERHRIVATTAKNIETTVLDGYEAWQRVQDPADPARWRMTILNKDQIKRLRATTWANLAFYRGFERIGGRIEDLGTASIDGRPCRKVSFIHDVGIVFTRYFDEADGRLLQTETESGVIIKEAGEIVAGGIRFPKQIVNTTRLPDGRERRVTITFREITVNEPFADSLFTMPSFRR